MTKRDFIRQFTASGLHLMIPSENIVGTSPKGVVIRASPYSVSETMDRLQAFMRQHGITIYARIDQQAELRKVGQRIPPLTFILFGNPKTGGPIMADNPVAALDLPLKLLVWEDRQARVWIAYNDDTYIGGRYQLSSSVTPLLHLNGLVAEALNLE